MISSSENCLTDAIAGLIISEGLSLNLDQKLCFKKVLDLERTLSKGYNPPNRNITSKNLIYVIHDQNMKRNFTIIDKELDVFGLLFLGYGATISITLLLNILVPG